MLFEHQEEVEPGLVASVWAVAQAAARRPLAEVLKDLSSRNPDVRSTAQAELARIGREDSDELLEALKAEGEKFRRNRRVTRKVVWGLGSFIFLYTMIGLAIGLSTGKWDMLSNFATFGGVFGSLGAAAAMTPQHKSIVTIIAGMDDVRAVGWLIDALNSQDKQIVASVEEALVRLLPRIGWNDRELLDDERRRTLDKRLLKTTNGELGTGILQAFEEIGDSKSLDTIRTVSEGKAAFPFDPTVRRLAFLAEDAIRARAEKEHQSQVLLRATEQSDMSETLLRPAEGSGAAPEQILLRPTEG